MEVKINNVTVNVININTANQSTKSETKTDNWDKQTDESIVDDEEDVITDKVKVIDSFNIDL